ncbi:hypothetical protein APY04_1946 [Hyphomicrobium sulfonivorans]|uniref:Uncharacterized protein n=1 Tax=Hyphomicrobium sulfonivorans TaxID=121290 RepID=A0A109BEQ1_HYPSL|nr:hypothetical protein APY04_1946 [Hyphomicrobium sulfonivorans]
MLASFLQKTGELAANWRSGISHRDSTEISKIILDTDLMS